MNEIQEFEPKSASKIFIWQMGFFAVLLGLAALVNTFTTMADVARAGHPQPLWEPAVWEISSNLIIWLLVPWVAWWLARFPINREQVWRSAPAHLVAFGVFSLSHIGGMILLRKLAYHWMGQRYDFGPIWDNWLYELRKDSLTYFVIVAGLLAFRTYGLWLDARSRTAAAAAVGATHAADAVHPAGATEPPPVPAPAAVDSPLGRLLVRKRNREFILDAAEIDHLEADGNYVVVHSGGESYRTRDSLESLSKRLGQQRFARVHRAHVVNIDRIREIQPWDHGDYRIVLKDGSFVNFSRRYRSRLQHLFQ